MCVRDVDGNEQIFIRFILFSNMLEYRSSLWNRLRLRDECLFCWKILPCRFGIRIIRLFFRINGDRNCGLSGGIRVSIAREIGNRNESTSSGCFGLLLTLSAHNG